MKIFKPILATLIGAVLFIACQKEYSLEGGNPLGGFAAGTLQDTSGNCLPRIINGTYRQDSTLGDSNFVSLQVNFTSPGSYKIFTDVANGFTFRDSGFAAAAGLQTIKLRGIGKPTAATPTTFNVSFGTSLCTFSVNVLPSLAGPAAVYGLAGNGSTCTAANVQGTYKVGTPLTPANRVTLSVSVTTPGAYTITTTPVNGMTFTAAGTFTTTGTQTVELQGSGTLTTAGPNTINVTAGGTTCSFAVTVAAAAAPGMYTLAGAGGNCTGATMQGTYQAGTPLGASNTATVSVNVTAAGSYTITTSTVNGMTFSKTGTFTTTGTQNVVLQGSGTPTAAGTNTFPVTGGSTTCSFTVTVAPAGNTGGPTAADSAWSFTGASIFNHGSIFEAFDTTLTTTAPGTYLVYDGEKYPTGDTGLYIVLRMTGSTIQTGTYSTTQGSGFAFYDVATGNDYYAADALTPQSNMTFTLTTFNATTGAFTGTFSGTAMNVTNPATPVPVTITGGKFAGVMR